MKMVRIIWLLLFIYFFQTVFVFAVPINSDMALTPFKGQTIIRLQVRYTEKSDATAEKDQDMQIWMFPNTFVYGVTEKFAVSVTAPYVQKRLKSTTGSSRSTVSESGIGDIKLMSKYRIWSKDLPGEARRISLIGGLELPTGDDETQLKLGSGSVDPIAGVLFSKQYLDHEFDIDLTYQFNTEADGFQFGDVFKYNLAYQHRVLPQVLLEKGVYSQLNLVLELNGEYAEKDKSSGSKIENSGGNILFISPGIQWVTKRWILESSIQIPLVQDLNGNQLETDYTGVLSFRLTF